MAAVELIVIDDATRLRDFKQQLRSNEVYYALSRGWGG
jgi:L-arabinose isomerase